MKKTIFVLTLIISSIIVSGQLQDRIWIFGRPVTGNTNATLYFDDPPTNPVATLPCGQPNQITTSNGFDIWTVVTHPYTGNLVFYTDGQSVFDASHNMVDIDTTSPGYESLGGCFSSSQPAAVSTVPGSSAGQFYIFSNPTGASGSSAWRGPITYRLYNVLTNTFGQTQYLPGPYGASDVSEGMKLIQSETNPHVLWLITSLFPDPGYTTRYVIYRIENALITYNGYCDMGPTKNIVGGIASPMIVFSATEAGTTSGITRVSYTLQSTSSVNVVDFDNNNGQFLTNTIRSYNTGYGSIPSVAYSDFSPNGQFLYFSIYYLTSTTNGIYQIDLQDSILSAVQIHTYNWKYAGGISLAPDSLIYHIYDGGGGSDNVIRIGRVLQPNTEYIPGVTNYSQFYEENYITFNNMIGYGFCSFFAFIKRCTNLNP